MPKRPPPLTIVGATADIPQPPRPLGKYGLDLWRRVLAQYDISDAGGVELLCLACQAIDRAERCREQIDRDGEMIKTRTGIRSNPLLRDELANRAYASRTLDRLGINSEGLKTPGRPPIPLHWPGPHGE
jgi:phage terminase small subunit